MAPPYQPRFHKTKRCRFFSENGKPLLLTPGIVGCRNTSKDCNYVHPDEPQWDTTHPATYFYPPKPAPKGVLHSPPHSSARLPSLYGPPPPPSTPSLKVEARDRVPSTSSAPGAHVDQDRDVDMRPPRVPRGHSPAQSIASSSGRRRSYVASGARMRDEEKEDDRGRYRDDDRRRSDEKRNEERSTERDRRRDEDRYRDNEYRRSDRRRDDRSRDRRDRSSSRPRRPSSSSRHRQRSSPRPPPKELTMDEKRELWLERINLLLQTVKTRSELLRLQEDVKKFERLAKSAQYEGLPEDDKAAIQKLVESANSRYHKKQEELNYTAGRLIPDDFWPFAQRVQHAADAGYQQMVRTLAGLRKEVEDLHGALASVQNLRPSAAETAAPSGPATATATKPEPGEIPNEPPSRPKKRRRLSTDASTRVPDLSAGETEKIRDHLAMLTHRISELQNDFLQYDSKVADEVEAELDYKLAGLRLGVGGDEDRPADPELQEKVQKLSDTVHLSEVRSTQALKDIADLQLDGQSLAEECARIQTETQDTKKTLEEALASQSQMSEALSAYRTEIRTLNEAITAIGARGAYPPPPPASLTADEIVEAIRPQLLNAARDDLNPILADVRAHIQKELQEQSSQVSGDLMTQMGPVVRSVEWISAWIERIRGPNGAIITTSTAASSASSDKGKGVAR